MELQQNKRIANQLREAATLLDEQGANRFRIAAYRKAADTVEALREDIGTILHNQGFEGLTALPGIGRVLGTAIVEIIRTGQWRQLERMRGVLDPERLFRRVPGIGPGLARQVVDELHVDGLEALEAAAHDGRLEKVSGFGPRRVAMVKSALADLLGKHRFGVPHTNAEPSISDLLDVDREYREKAVAGELRRIAPTRFNPDKTEWLPILHTERGEWQFTVMHSNTALAHKLNRVRDWVVIYFHSDSRIEGQRTVVSETHGTLKGKRVVRGREQDCGRYYQPELFAPSHVA